MRRKLIDRSDRARSPCAAATGNLLTGAAYVSLDFFPGAPPATVDWSQSPLQLPTTPGQFEATEATVENIIKKLDKVPFQEIGDDLQKAIAQLNADPADRTRHLDERARHAG